MWANCRQAYWLAIYSGISLPEHFIFRGGFSGYAPEQYDQPHKLPPSFAALGAFCFGILGAVLGMAQVWFIVCRESVARRNPLTYSIGPHRQNDRHWIRW